MHVGCVLQVEMANERTDRSEGEDMEESGEAKRPPRGAARPRRFQRNSGGSAPRRRRHESDDAGDEQDSTPTKGSSPRRMRRRKEQRSGPGVWIGNLPRNLKVNVVRTRRANTFQNA